MKTEKTEKTEKYDINDKEIQLGDKIKVVAGNGFQALGKVCLKNGGIIIDWIDKPPNGCYSNLLCDYYFIEIMPENIQSIPFHETLNIEETI